MDFRALILFSWLVAPCIVRAQVEQHRGPSFVAPPPTPIPYLTTLPFPDARVGQPFTYQVGGEPTLTSVEIAGLPPGLSFNAERTIAGTPTEAGVFRVTFNGTYAGGVYPSSSLDLTVTPALATINITAKVSRTVAGSGRAAVFALTRQGDLSGELGVFYTIGGNSRNGEDYYMLDGVATFNANARRTTVRIIPYDMETIDNTVTIKLTLSPSSYYLLGSARAKVKIVPAGQ